MDSETSAQDIEKRRTDIAGSDTGLDGPTAKAGSRHGMHPSGTGSSHCCHPPTVLRYYSRRARRDGGFRGRQPRDRPRGRGGQCHRRRARDRPFRRASTPPARHPGGSAKAARFSRAIRWPWSETPVARPCPLHLQVQTRADLWAPDNRSVPFGFEPDGRPQRSRRDGFLNLATRHLSANSRPLV